MPRRRRSRRSTAAAASGGGESPLGQNVPGRSLSARASGGGDGPPGHEVLGLSGSVASGGGGEGLGQDVPGLAASRSSGGDGPLGPEIPGLLGSAVASGGGEDQPGHNEPSLTRVGSGSQQRPHRMLQQWEVMFLLGSDSPSESEDVIPFNGTSRAHELADSDPPPSDLSGKERKRKRGMITTSSLHSDRLSSESQLDTREAGIEKSTDSSEDSSPIRRPRSLFVKETTASGDVVYRKTSDQEVVAAHQKDSQKYQEKLARLQELPTLKPCKYGPNITHWNDLNQKKAVLDVARSVVTISSYNGGTEINRCSGIIIEWIEVNRSAIVVTSPQIICTKTSLDDWEDNNVYAPNAKVIAHLPDGTTSELRLLYFSKHYSIACFKLTAESGINVVSLDPKVQFGHEACVLARDTMFGLVCRRTVVKAIDPCGHQKNHWLFIGSQIPMCCSGGALANFDRNVVGMVLSALPNAAFIPSSIILNCLRLWKRFGHLARPHLGLKLKNVDFMDVSYLECLSHMFKINSGLIVTRVSAESTAEKNGIRPGDVILNCQGVAVSSISQFEGILLEVCEKQYEINDNLEAKVDIELVVYNTKKNVRRTITMSVHLSDRMEVFT